MNCDIHTRETLVRIRLLPRKPNREKWFDDGISAFTYTIADGTTVAGIYVWCMDKEIQKVVEHVKLP